MNTLEAISSRKSNRNYTSQKIEKEVLSQIAKAGSYGAAGMAKPVYITVVTNADAIQALNDATKQAAFNSGNDLLVKVGSNPNWNPLYHAPVIMLVSTDFETETSAIGNNTSNCACAGQNILLAATELGVASCFTTSPTMGFFIPGIKEKLGVPENQTVSAVITLGYSDDNAPSYKHINENNIAFFE